MAKAANQAIIAPSLGLYLGQPSITIPPRGLEDCLNVRIANKKLSSFNMGWTKWITRQLDSPVTLVDNFWLSDNTQILVVGTLTDLYRYDANTNDLVFINPRYETGTAAASGTAVTGTGTSWSNLVRDGDMIAFGASGETDPDATWYRITDVPSDTSITISSSAGTVANGAYTIRRRFQSGNIYNFWRTETFPRADINGDGTTIDDYWFATNLVDYPVYWNGTDDQIQWDTGLGFKCQDLVRFKNMMLYLNITDDSGAQKPYSMKNSDVGRPRTMTGGLAGEFVVSPSVDVIQAAAQLGNDLIVYTEGNVIDVSFVGSPDIFAIRTAIQRVGLVAPRMLGVFPDYHQFLNDDGLYQFNGVQGVPIHQHIWRDVTTKIDPNRKRGSFAIIDEEHGELIWAPTLTTDPASGTNTGPNFAYQEHYLEETDPNVPTPYTRRDFPFTAAGYFARASSLKWSDITTAWNVQNFSWSNKIFSAAFPFILVGDQDGYLYSLNTADTQDGVALTSYALFPKRAIGDMRHRNMVRRVYPMVKALGAGNYTLTVTTVVYDQEGQGSGTNSILQFDMTLTDKHFVSPYRRGRFAQVQFGTAGSASGQPWELHGYDWDVLPGGMR